MRISLLSVLLFFMFSVFNGSWAQDRLLLTNGRIKTLKGEVSYFDHNDIFYQTEKQKKREQNFLDKKGLTAAEFDAQERERVASDREKLEIRKREMEMQIIEKMKSLSPEDFEKWKNEQLLKLKEQEAVMEIDRGQRKKRRFTKRLKRDEVFSILKSDSSEIVVYSADTLGFLAFGEAEMEYGVEEMRMYIKGRQDGRKHKTAFDIILGVAVGAISSGAGAYWGPSIPAGTVVVTSIFHNKIKNKAGVNPDLFENDPYRDGYDRSAKKKKAWGFVKGSVAGLGFGMLFWDGIVRGEGLPGPR